ncbi:endothelial PAS domain-containing protein 1-like [Engraulis encrasicolus]|uniref:endothelial PAS domain-containing protein 1-like n=1 Tax=Engraulis encrasicolus TaxID=184585 RepID=UPI002FD0FF3C
MTAVESKGVSRPLSERRKERSREAARFRRSKEAELFCQLAQQLPLPESITSHLDKASIIRLALSYLRTRKLFTTGVCYPSSQAAESKQTNPLSLQSLEGFLLVLMSSGDIIYVTENMSTFMGLSPMELIGHNIYDFTHPCDHGDIQESLSIRGALYSLRRDGRKAKRDFFIRMKCTVTNRGRTVNLKSAGWKVLHCTGHLSATYNPAFSCPIEYVSPFVSMMLLCEPIPAPPRPDAPISSHVFISQHSMDMKIIGCDDRVISLLGYHPDDLSRRSMYELCHASDVPIVARSHKILCVMGQVVSGPYRLLAKQGGYVWIETQATVLQDTRHHRPQLIICLNALVSNVEKCWMAFSVEQREAVQMDRCQTDRPLPSVLKQEHVANSQPEEATCNPSICEPPMCP